MTETLSNTVLDALAEERARLAKRRSARTVRAGGGSYPVVRHWDRGFSVEVDGAPRLRGLVNVYDGDRHVFNALVIMTAEEAGERVYEFKYATPASETPPVVDFVRDDPVALIPRQ